MFGDQYIQCIGWACTLLCLLTFWLLRPKPKRMPESPKKETYADFICWSLTEEPRAWVANEFRVLNAGRKINLWVANGAAFIRDESNPSSFSYREKRRIWRAVKRNSHLRTMLPVDVEAAETETEAPEPPKSIPYKPTGGPVPNAPVTREEFEELRAHVGLVALAADQVRIDNLSDRVAALEAARAHELPDAPVTQQEMVDLATQFAVTVGALNNRISALEAAQKPGLPDGVRVFTFSSVCGADFYAVSRGDQYWLSSNPHRWTGPYRDDALWPSPWRQLHGPEALAVYEDWKARVE